jgi:hypothetical protein
MRTRRSSARRNLGGRMRAQSRRSVWTVGETGWPAVPHPNGRSAAPPSQRTCPRHLVWLLGARLFGRAGHPRQSRCGGVEKARARNRCVKCGAAPAGSALLMRVLVWPDVADESASRSASCVITGDAMRFVAEAGADAGGTVCRGLVRPVLACWWSGIGGERRMGLFPATARCRPGSVAPVSAGEG